MFRKNKFDFVVYTSGCMRLVIFFFIFFVVLSASGVKAYVFERKTIDLFFVALVGLIIIFGLNTLFLYWVISNKIYISKKKIIAKTWCGFRKKFDVNDISKVVFEKSEGDVVTAKIFVKNFSNKYLDNQNNFSRLLDFLIDNVEKEKITCYILGTKKETTL